MHVEGIERLSLTNFNGDLSNSSINFMPVIVVLVQKAVVIGPFVEHSKKTALRKQLVIAFFKVECFKVAFVFDFCLNTSYNEQ